MSKIDQKYIDALDNFTDALQQIVDTLKEQQETSKEDVVNEMLKNTPINSIHQVVKDLKKVTEKGFSKVESGNKEIIKKIESIKQQREAGMFDRIEDPKNKNKIVDGIKVVALIAGGVLAMGMAFKLIGKVDFLSVVALSSAMLLMAKAFSEIIDIKHLSYKNVFIAASIIPLMALALTASGFILSVMPRISPIQGLSILLISGALGIASYLLLKAVGKFDAKSLIMIPLLPVILPMIALGIVASSYILQYTKQISLMQVFSVSLVGLALVVATIGMAFALKAMKNITWKEMLMLPLMIPLIAGGIVLASWIFQGFEPIKSPLQLIIGSAVIGLSMLFFVPAIWLLGKMKAEQLLKGIVTVLPLVWVMTMASNIFQDFTPVKDPLKLGISSLAIGLAVLFFAPAVWLLGKLSLDQIIKGSLAVLTVSGAILATAWIFSFLPENMTYPPFMWTLGAGLSVLAFSLLATGVGFFATTLAPFFWVGLLGMLAVAGSIVGVSLILQKGNFTGNYPSLQWALGVGGSLLIFSIAAIAASVAGIVSAVTSLFTGDKDPLMTVAQSMVDVSTVLQSGVWDAKYPTLDWAKGVGTALLLFATGSIIAAGADFATKIISFFIGESDPLLKLVNSMVNVSKAIQEGNYAGNYPSYKWSLGVGTALSLFAGVTVLSGGAKLASSIVGFFTGDKDPLMTLAKSMVSVSLIIQDGNYAGNYPSYKWSLGVGTALSLFAGVTVLSGGSKLSSAIVGFFTGDKDPLMTLAKSVVLVSKEIQEGIYTSNYPKEDWAKGVGTALTLFAGVTILSGGSKLSNAIVNFFSRDKSDPLMTLANSMVNVSLILQKGKYDNAPSKTYTSDVINFLNSINKLVDDWDVSQKEAKIFNDAINEIIPAIKNLSSIPNINASMVKNMQIVKDSLIELALGLDVFMYEKPEGAFNKIGAVFTGGKKRSMEDFINFSRGLTTLMTGLQLLSTLRPLPSNVLNGYTKFMLELNNFPQLSEIDSKTTSITNLANAFLILSNSLSSVNSNLEGFTNLSRGIALISVVDETKFENVLQTIDKHKGTLQVISQMSGEDVNLLSAIKGLYETINTEKPSEEKTKMESIESEQQKRFYEDISEIRNLLYEFRDHLDRPSQNGSFHK